MKSLSLIIAAVFSPSELAVRDHSKFMRNTGPVKFENDLRNKLLSRFQKMKNSSSCFQNKKKTSCPVHGKKQHIQIAEGFFCSGYQILAINRMRYHVVTANMDKDRTVTVKKFFK